MAKTFLDGVYDHDKKLETEALYDAWSASYDQEIADNGYATPRRCAEALAELAPDLTAPVLDLGCGTGLSGLALRAVGFTAIDGFDLSKGMLEKARARQGVYRSLTQVSEDAPFPVSPGMYTHVNAAGVISPDHAPPETVDAVIAVLPQGGCLVYSINDHAAEVAAFRTKAAEVAATGVAELAFEEHGDHLPGIGLKATVYGLRKT